MAARYNVQLQNEPLELSIVDEKETVPALFAHKIPLAEFKLTVALSSDAEVKRSPEAIPVNTAFSLDAAIRLAPNVNSNPAVLETQT